MAETSSTSRSRPWDDASHVRAPGQWRAVDSDTGPDPILGVRFIDALGLAVELHSRHARKGSKIPYLGHLLGVCGLVLDAGGSEPEAIAAILYDAVEDQGGAPTLDRIRVQFGGQVAAIVDGCSDTDIIPKPPWRHRKKAYIEHLRCAPEAVLRVSAADKLNNLRAVVRDYDDIGEALWLDSTRMPTKSGTTAPRSGYSTRDCPGH